MFMHESEIAQTSEFGGLKVTLLQRGTILWENVPLETLSMRLETRYSCGEWLYQNNSISLLISYTEQSGSQRVGKGIDIPTAYLQCTWAEYFEYKCLGA